MIVVSKTMILVVDLEMKTSKNLLTKLLLLFLFFLEVQHSQYFLQQILNFKLLFVLYLKISL